jgi:hypothetical protein
VSLENLSTISPTGVSEFDDLDESFFLSTSTSKYLGVVEEAALDYYTAPVLCQQYDPSPDKEVPMGGDGAPGEDPLEWLLENDSSTLQHLPESSLKACPMFPDFSDLSSSSPPQAAARDPQDGGAGGDISCQPPPGLARRADVDGTVTGTGTGRSMVVDVTDNLPYADPKVTVQSLFLVDGEGDDGSSAEHDDDVVMDADGMGPAAAADLLLP